MWTLMTASRLSAAAFVSTAESVSTSLTRTTVTVASVTGKPRPPLSLFPEVIGQLSNLTQLDLSSNQITAIPEVIGQLT